MPRVKASSAQCHKPAGTGTVVFDSHQDLLKLGLLYHKFLQRGKKVQRISFYLKHVLKAV
jgi:hypothetical protein